MRRFCAKNPKNTLFLASQEYLGLRKYKSEVGQDYPPPPQWKFDQNFEFCFAKITLPPQNYGQLYQLRGGGVNI